MSSRLEKIDTKFIDILCKMAVDVQPVANARIASAIVLKNNIISFGINQRKTHPFQARFGRNSESIYMHAEISAIHNALKRIDVSEISKSTLYIARMKKRKFSEKTFNWVTGNVCPCEGCMRAIVEFGIKRVVYTGEDGTIEEL